MRMAEISIAGRRSGVLEPLGVIGTGLQTPAWENGWGHYPSANVNEAAFFRDDDGIVRLQGMIQNMAPQGDTVFRLPPRYRPAEQIIIPAARYGGLQGGPTYLWSVPIVIQADGAFNVPKTNQFWNGGTVLTQDWFYEWVMLDGLSFWADA